MNVSVNSQQTQLHWFIEIILILKEQISMTKMAVSIQLSLFKKQN